MLSVKESAAILGVSEARVRKLIADDVLSATKIGRSWVLREEDVMNRIARKPRSGRPRAQASTDRPSCEEPGTRVAQEKAQELHQLYRACKQAFKLRPDAACIQSASSSEEAAFYMTVADFFLQQKQAQLVKRGVY